MTPKGTFGAFSDCHTRRGLSGLLGCTLLQACRGYPSGAAVQTCSCLNMCKTAHTNATPNCAGATTSVGCCLNWPVFRCSPSNSVGTGGCTCLSGAGSKRRGRLEPKLRCSMRGSSMRSSVRTTSSSSARASLPRPTGFFVRREPRKQQQQQQQHHHHHHRCHEHSLASPPASHHH